MNPGVPGGPRPLASGPRVPPPLVEVRDIRKVYGRRVVLDGVSLTLRPGEIVGVIGPGGHGKSVLLKTLPLLVRPDAGRVLFRGEDALRFGARRLGALRREFGYLFQNYALFDSMTVFDNVAFPLRRAGVSEQEVAARVPRCLKRVGLGAAAGLYPDELSGGMKKRVGLARAVVAQPPVALYDDPSAGLDPVTSSKIFRLVAQLHAARRDAVTVVVSHDIDRMRAVCGRYVMLQRGRVVFDGPEAALATAPQAVRDFFFGAAAASGAARREDG